MTYLDGAKLDQFFRSVAGGFATTPKEILLFFAILTAIFLFLVIFYFLQRRRIQGQLLNQSAKKYSELINRYDLSGAEVKTLEGMAECLPAEKQKYLLLLNPHLFNVCAAKLQSKKQVPEPILASLRLKLGFRLEQAEDVPSSSAQLPRGMPVHLIVPGRPGMQGSIAAQQSWGIVLSLEDKDELIPAGTVVRVYFKNRTGIYSFSSKVIRATRRVLTLRHSEKIKQYQRRNYYRRPTGLTVFVSPLHERSTTRRSTLLDLGGGGASLVNPKKIFKEGDLLELNFAASASEFRVPARVVRTSKGSSVLHVQFESIAESVRDRIIGSLYRITEM